VIHNQEEVLRRVDKSLSKQSDNSLRVAVAHHFKNLYFFIVTRFIKLMHKKAERGYH
jgi:hypothetical protein